MEQPLGAMPSPFELANKNKIPTVTMSLRIKQTTKDFFERQAKMIANSEDTEGDKDKSPKTSASSLMNNLLDSYAESYIQQAAETPVTAVLRPYLENMAKKIFTMDDESLILRAFRPGRPTVSELLVVQNYDNVDELMTDFWTLKNQDPELPDIVISPSYPAIMTKDRDLEIRCDKRENKADAECITDKIDYLEIRIIDVVPEKWPIVIAIADSYMRKIQELGGEDDSNSSFSIKKFEELADVINSTDDKEELAKKLVEFFVSYAEQVYE